MGEVPRNCAILPHSKRGNGNIDQIKGPGRIVRRQADVVGGVTKLSTSGRAVGEMQRCSSSGERSGKVAHVEGNRDHLFKFDTESCQSNNERKAGQFVA